MDAITEFIAKDHPELGVQLDYYAVSGASKRGWTTWDVGAVDPKRYTCPVIECVSFTLLTIQ